MAHPGGRPPYVLDDKQWALLRMLCGLPLFIVTNETIADMMRTQEGLQDISLKTLTRLVKAKFKVSFVQFRQQNQGVLKARLLSKQYELALKGNTGLLIWLGKQYLGQSDDPIQPDTPEEYDEPKLLDGTVVPQKPAEGAEFE